MTYLTWHNHPTSLLQDHPRYYRFGITPLSRNIQGSIDKVLPCKLVFLENIGHELNLRWLKTDRRTELSHNLNFFPQTLSEGMCKTHYGKQNFSSFAFRVYFIVINTKTPLCNGNRPITDPITEIGVAHAFEHRLACQGGRKQIWPGTHILNF